MHPRLTLLDPDLRRLKLLALAILLLAAVDLGGLLALRRLGGLSVRYQAVPTAELDRLGRAAPLFAVPDSAYFAGEMRRAGIARGGRPDDQVIRDVLRWTMTQAGDTGFGVAGFRPSARDQLEFARAGGGLDCSHMGLIFHGALHALGFHARLVTLMADASPRVFYAGVDTHQTVEVLLDGRWTVFDPTFHVSFAREGRLLGAREVQHALLAGEGSAVEPVFHGEVRYPARLETYPISWTELYRYVFLARDASGSLAARVPPVRFWAGPAFLYADDGASSAAAWMGAIYFTLVVLLPVVLLLLGALLAARLAARLRLPSLGERTAPQARPVAG